MTEDGLPPLDVLLAAVRARLPSEATELDALHVAVSYSAEIGRLSDRLHAHLVTITGTGGVQRDQSSSRQASAPRPRFLPVRFYDQQDAAQPTDRVPVELPAGLDRHIEQVERSTEHMPPSQRLEVASVAAAELHDLAEQLVATVLGQARAAGASWAEILFAASDRWRSSATTVPQWSVLANQACESARQAAAGCRYISTAHLLIGIISVQSDGIPAAVLTRYGVSADVVSGRVQAMAGDDTAPPRLAPVTGRILRTRAAAQARKLGASRIEPEHLFLCLLTEPDSVAALLLADLGLDPARLHHDVLELLDIV